LSDPQQATGWTVYRLPRSHWHCTLDGFDWHAVGPAALQATVKTFCEALTEGHAPHLVLSGEPGIGKTHVGVGLYRWATTLVGTAHATWVNVPAFCERVKRSFDDEADPWEDIDAARRLVVLDDLFGRDLSQFEASHIVYRLIDTAYQNNAAVCVTMNQTVEELPSRLAAHEVSRILADSTVVVMQSRRDWRR